jgi:uncharacterized membrane protein YphA (DoxX/SURF4 family)
MTAAPRPLERVDVRLTRWMAHNGLTLLRISLGLVFFWFGFLKFFRGMSPADDLAARTIEALSGGAIQPNLSLPVLAIWESIIGLGLLFGVFMRTVLLLLGLQMIGTLTPLVLFPDARGAVHHQERGSDQRSDRPRRFGARRRAGRGTRSGPRSEKD